MIERKFGLEDITVAVKGKKGYVSVVGDFKDILHKIITYFFSNPRDI